MTMSAQAVAATFVLVVLQLVVLRASQHAKPTLYFTTSSLFDRRSDVSGAAVLFRLSIPFAAGGLAALLVSDDAILVGAISGGATWFLVIWPIIWNPRLVSHRYSWPFVGVLFAFWLAFISLPLAGGSLVELISNVISAEGAEWKSQYAWALVTGATFTAAAEGTSWLARRRLSFVDDRSSAADSSRGEADEEEWEEDEGDRSESALGEFFLLYGTETFGFAAVAVCAVALFALARKR